MGKERFTSAVVIHIYISAVCVMKDQRKEKKKELRLMTRIFDLWTLLVFYVPPFSGSIIIIPFPQPRPFPDPVFSPPLLLIYLQ